MIYVRQGANNIMERKELHKLGKQLIEWMMDPPNFLVSAFAAENGISKKRLASFAKSDEEFNEILELAYTIQEVKVAKGALAGQIKEAVALRLLETFHDWKSDAKVVSTSEFKLYADSAEKRAQELMNRVKRDGDD